MPARKAAPQKEPTALGTKIFIGHGRSSVWRELKDFLADRLKLDCVEFNSESAAGVATKERLEEMLRQSGFAFLVLTAEDERVDGTRHARENVIHECGLFQGWLGFKRAIVLLEQGCAQFSNIHGLTHIAFPTGSITAAYEEIRRVLEREGLIREGLLENGDLDEDDEIVDQEVTKRLGEGVSSSKLLDDKTLANRISARTSRELGHELLPAVIRPAITQALKRRKLKVR